MSFGGDAQVLLVTGVSGCLGTMLADRLPDALIVGIYNHSPPKIDSQAFQALYPAEPARVAAPRALVIRADLSSERECERIVELALARFGRIDHLINIAADLRFLGNTTEAWGYERDALRQFRLNALVPLRLASLVARDFWKHRPEENRRLKRSVVNVSSISGLQVYPAVGQATYSASKAALNFLSLHMCEDYDAIGIRVNVVAPTAFPRLVPTESVADSIIQLLSSDANGKIV